MNIEKERADFAKWYESTTMDGCTAWDAWKARAAAAVAGADWKLVPVELDVAMHTEMDRAISDAMHVGVPVSPEGWAAALAAAPTPAEDNDFPLGPACDLSGEGHCTACE